MTQREATELDKAIERAEKNGITVLARGTFKRDNVKFYLTNSASHPNGVHVVRLHHSRLVCDCEAAQHGRICAHRAATHLYLVNEAAKRQALSDAVEQALEAETAIAKPATDSAIKPRKTTTQAPGWTAPLHRSSSAISIWK